MSHAELLQPLQTVSYPCELFIPSNCQRCFAKKHFFFSFFFFLPKGGGRSVSETPSHAQTQNEPKWKLSSSSGWSPWRVVGRIPGRIMSGNSNMGGGNILESYWANHLVCPDRVSVCHLSIWPPVIWVVNSSAVYIQLSFEKRIPVLYEVEFSDVY